MMPGLDGYEACRLVRRIDPRVRFLRAQVEILRRKLGNDRMIPNSGGNSGRLEVLLTNLVVTAGGPAATMRFFGEEQVIANDDATWTDASHPEPLNGLNNASNIELTVAGVPSEFSFALLGGPAATEQETPAIRRWKAIDPAVTESTVFVPDEGMFIICSKATSLGGSPPMWHYEYAAYNLNSDRCAGTVSVPLNDSLVATNIGFHGVPYRGGDGEGGVNVDGSAWADSRPPGALRWATQSYDANHNANSLRWGATYNFRFDTPLAPATGEVTIGLWKGGPGSITATAQVPRACVAPIVADVNCDCAVNFFDVDPFLLALFDEAAYAAAYPDCWRITADANGDGSVDLFDIDPFLACLFDTCP